MKTKGTLSPQKFAQLSAAQARGVAKIKENARIRKISAVKQNEKTNQILMRNADTLARAAMIPALGAKYIYKVGADKKSVQVRDPDEIAHALDLIHADTPYDTEHQLYYMIVVDKPDIKAIEIIWNKMFGKAIDKKEIEVVFSLKSLANLRRDIPELAPMPVEARVLDAPK
jgi:5-enolpyruvylshikimate-3-phosphate synthase